MGPVKDKHLLVERTRYESNLLEVLDETALEERHGTLDVRGNPSLSAFMIGPAVAGQGRIDDLLSRLRPLLTGAAWKILVNSSSIRLGTAPAAAIFPSQRSDGVQLRIQSHLHSHKSFARRGAGF